MTGVQTCALPILRDAVEQKLVEVRESRTRELTQYFDTLESSLVTTAQGSSAAEAVRGFTAGFAALDAQPVDPTQAKRVQKYYEDTFVGPYKDQTGIAVDTAALLPRSSAQTYLQATYTATSTDFAQKLATDDAGDGSGTAVLTIVAEDRKSVV